MVQKLLMLQFDEVTRARVCARGCVWVRVCEAGRTVGLPGEWVCGCAACVCGCTCVDV